MSPTRRHRDPSGVWGLTAAGLPASAMRSLVRWQAHCQALMSKHQNRWVVTCGACWHQPAGNAYQRPKAPPTHPLQQFLCRPLPPASAPSPSALMSVPSTCPDDMLACRWSTGTAARSKPAGRRMTSRAQHPQRSQPHPMQPTALHLMTACRLCMQLPHVRQGVPSSWRQLSGNSRSSHPRQRLALRHSLWQEASIVGRSRGQTRPSRPALAVPSCERWLYSWDIYSTYIIRIAGRGAR